MKSQAFPSSVLIVDDEPKIRELLRRWLSRDYECFLASNTTTAWQTLQHSAIDVVLLDVRMPGESGIEFLPKIRAAFPDLEVILLTGYGGEQTAIRALNEGAAAYLTKPCNRTELVSRVNLAAERKTLRMVKHFHTRQLEIQVREQTEKVRKAHQETVQRLLQASLHRDVETGEHVQRIGQMSALLSEALGWSAPEVDLISLAAPLHDIGKIGVPDAILRKPGPLTSDERQIMQGHTQLGASMLEDSDSEILQLGKVIALSHHEKWDGSGYPYGLIKAQIPEAARIVAIVDVYDALTHDRVYRAAMKQEQALELIQQGRGSHFDPEICDAFFSRLPELGQVGKDHPDDSKERMSRPGIEAINTDSLSTDCYLTQGASS